MNEMNVELSNRNIFWTMVKIKKIIHEMRPRHQLSGRPVGQLMSNLLLNKT